MRLCTRFVLLCVFAAIAIQPLLAQSQLSEEEYRVYNGVVRYLYSNGEISFDLGGKIEVLVVRDQTNANNPTGTMKGSERQQALLRIAPLTDELVKAYEKTATSNVLVR